MKRRIIKGQAGVPKLKPITREQADSIWQAERSVPYNEPWLAKAVRYISNPFDIVSDYVQGSDWAPDWLKEAAPWISFAAGAAGGGPVKKNGWASRGQSKNNSNWAKKASIEARYPIAKSGNRKQGRGKNKDYNDDYDPEDIIWDEKVEQRNRVNDAWADRVRQRNHKARSAPKNKPKETPQPPAPRPKTKKEELMERLRKQNEQSKKNSN